MWPVEVRRVVKQQFAGLLEWRCCGAQQLHRRQRCLEQSVVPELADVEYASPSEVARPPPSEVVPAVLAGMWILAPVSRWDVRVGVDPEVVVVSADWPGVWWVQAPA